MIIGIPKEIMPGENRVAATPATVKEMISLGLTVLVEISAGSGSYIDDQDYIDAGAKIVDSASAVFNQADIILKVKEPLFNYNTGKHEADMMHAGQYLITFIHPAAPVNHDMVRKLAKNGVNAITLDGIPRISRAQNTAQCSGSNRRK